MLKGKTVAPLTLGCKVNQYETDGMIELLKEAGMTAVSFEEKADVYLINTCSVTNMADKKSRQMIHRAKKLNPDAVVIAAGCYVQAAKDKLMEDDRISIIIGNNKKNCKWSNSAHIFFYILECIVISPKKHGKFLQIQHRKHSNYPRNYCCHN